MPTSKDFRGSGSHKQLFRPYWGPPAWHSHWVKERVKPASQKPLTAEKQSIKCQLYTTHEGAVGWELHSSSTTTCMGKVDHKSPVNQSKGHTYTNPQPSYYLMHAHSHITLVGSHGQRFCPHWGSTAWHGHWSVTGKTCVQRPFTAEASPLQCKCQFHTTHVGAVGWEPHCSSTTTCAGKADHRFGVCVPVALICLLKIVN